MNCTQMTAEGWLAVAVVNLLLGKYSVSEGHETSAIECPQALEVCPVSQDEK